MIHMSIFANTGKYDNSNAKINAPAPIETPTPVSTVAQTGTFDDRNAAIYYYGTWTDYSGSGPYSNTLRYTSMPYAYAVMTFLGTRITLKYTATVARGHADIYIDGNMVTRLDMCMHGHMASVIKEQSGLKLSYTAILVYILAHILKHHPCLNSSFSNNEIFVCEYDLIGIATNLDDYLIVPMVHYAQKGFAPDC
jgi:hypothetical protein